MKNKFIFTILAGAGLLAMTSCSDFLTEDPKGKISPETFFQSQDDLDMSVYALYAQIQDFQCNSNPMIVQCQGDDLTSTTGSNKAAYLSADAYEEPTDYKGLNDLWSKQYKIIQAANLIIDNAERVPTSQTEINIALGQAYYWRAFAYFSLVRVFGPLPINLHNEADNNTTPLTSVEGVYEQVVSDLKAAESCNLPAKYTATNRATGDANIYISEQAVKATLAAVYMNIAGYPLNKTEYYAQAAAKAGEVIDGVESGKYPQALNSSWADVYNYGNNYNKEEIVTIVYEPKAGGWGTGDSQFTSCHTLASIGGWGDFLPERKYWANYPDGPRKDYVFASKFTFNNATADVIDWWATTDGQPYNGNNAVCKEYCPMYLGFTLNRDANGDIVSAPYDYTLPIWNGMCQNKSHQIIRYSEVLCWYAEASARAGINQAKALQCLQKVQARAYSNPSACDNSNLAEAAYREHGYEVAGYPLALVTRRHDEFRMNRLKEGWEYRNGTQSTVIVPKGTVTHSVDSNGQPFTYTTTQDLVVKEFQPVSTSWNDTKSIYQVYPPSEVEKNPNLVK